VRIAYLDCFSGVSGDMLLGAMLDAGLGLDDLRSDLEGLQLSGFALSAAKVKRAGIAATHAVVDVSEEQPARTLADVLRIIADARLPGADKEKGAAIFRRLAEAEAKVHGETAEAVHLHDVAAVDAIVDVMGAVAGLRLLGAEKLYCSALPLGSGEVGGLSGWSSAGIPSPLVAAPRRHNAAVASARGAA